MPSVQRTPGDQNVASGAPWVGGASLLQNDHGVADIPVQKMDLHCRPCRRLSRESLNREAPQDSLGREVHVVHPRLFPRGGGCPTQSLLCRFPMLCLHVPCHQSSLHILPALPAMHPSPLPLLVGRYLSCHPYPLRRLQLVTRRLAWAVEHADCLPEISPQAHPIEQANQGTKCNLDPSWVGRFNHAIVCV